MATRPEDLQNWSLWDFDENPVFKFQTGNPTYGYGGGTVFSQQMEQNNQTAHVGMTEDGQYNMFVDDTLTISGGNTKEGGVCVNIVGKNGDVTITAERNGDVKIKGKNILIDADENLNISSKKNVTISGKSSIFFDTPNLATNAMTGNLAPRDVTFGGLTFRGTKVGGNAISDAFTGGKLDSLADTLKAQAPALKDKMKDIAGNIDTDAISGQLSGVTDQLSSIDTSGLSNALSNFGGFG
tara:strand:+ start:465 stop:1184 length:720 start_codon:yes stop_codon:yes gene_type:complete